MEGSQIGLSYTTIDRQWLNINGPFTTAFSKSFLSLLVKNLIAADLGLFRVIFFYILKMVYCVYLLESPG